MKPIPSTTTLRYLRQLLHNTSPNLTLPSRAAQPLFLARQRRHFHPSRSLQRTETHILSDIGEGVKEVQIIQWFIEEGAQVEEWDPLCEVQSDKAAVEITSKYTGTIKKLHFKRDAIVQVGDGMVDIEVEGEDGEGEDGAEESAKPGEESETEKKSEPTEQDDSGKQETKHESQPEQRQQPTAEPAAEAEPAQPQQSKGKHASLATPAVRAMLKEHNLQIESINGTGKDGRVMKEDVLNHVNKKASSSSSSTPATSGSTSTTTPATAAPQKETAQALTPIQSAMFKAMTRSLTIPHFLYTDSIDLTTLSALRSRLNATRNVETDPKLSFLPFILKAISLSLQHYPLLNARLDVSDSKPQLQMREQQNIGIAIDTPQGLLVPVIHSAQASSINSLASRITDLSARGRTGKLTNADLSGGTITVSNIGNIGGEVVAPVLVEGQVAICGVGKIKSVPVFDADGKVVKAEMCQLSWSADHRVVDGATMARFVSRVKGLLEEPGRMVLEMV